MDSTISEVQDPTNRFNERAGTDRKKFSAEKSKIIVKSTTNTSVDITSKGEKLGEMTSLKLGLTNS
ncbi:hypothetical protein DPMN_143268 [Dreissena polymorpha]|uniref:Uncharacterized protein n=1 Tax=Dreissena polymorpha TaxID=45954 RepID=A0A9D4JN19_DREPO|nr:hypothetical protein DPMN_143268 [Dreissena polymorpha]